MPKSLVNMVTSPNKESHLNKDYKTRVLQGWKKVQMNYMYLYNLNYTYRIKTEAVFEDKSNYIFDFFVLDDHLFE